MNTALYRGNGAGVVAHSMRRRKMTPPVLRQRSFSPGGTDSPRRRKVTHPIQRQRSISPGGKDSFPSPSSTYKKLPYSINSPTNLSHTYSNRLVTQTNSRKISSSQTQSSPRHLRLCTTNRRLENALDQFITTALPFYLEVLARHALKIQKVLYIQIPYQMISITKNV